MSNPVFTVRNYRSQDFNRLIQLASEAEQLKESFSSTSLQDLIEDLAKPYHFPEDNLFIAERSGILVGYLDVMPEPNIGRAVLNCLIHPKQPTKGLGRRIFGCGTQHARDLGLKRAHVNIPQGSTAARKLLVSMGFEFVRRFLELRLDLCETDVLRVKPIASPCRFLKRGEEEKLTQIQNRCFFNTWGYNPNTVEEIVYRTSLPGYSPRNIITALESDMLVGYCWTRTHIREHSTMHENKGRIYMLGVDPDHRGKGVGKQVLMAGLSHLKKSGVRIVKLTVDSANTAACALYRSVGFEVCASTMWYELLLS